MKHFYSADDVGNLPGLIQRAIEIGRDPLNNPKPGTGKTLVLLFLNPSLRTRLSTQKAAQNLGMHVIAMNMSEGWKLETLPGAIMNMDCAEHIQDAAKVIGEYADIAGIRAFPSLVSREDDLRDVVLRSFMKYSGVPIINLESAIFHPLQSLADFMTIREVSGDSKLKVVLSWAPHPRSLPHSVVNSFLDFGKMSGHEIHVCHPKGYELNEKHTGHCTIHYNQEEAFADADIIYAKNWSSTRDYGQVICNDPAWMIDERKMNLTNRAKFMHCLPVRRNVVVSDSVMDSVNSLVFRQAGNREFAAQAVLEKILINSPA